MTFIFWGLFHSILFLPSFIFKTNRKFVNSVIGENALFPTPKEFIQVCTTFFLVTNRWVFFRSQTIGDSFEYLKNMFFEFNFSSKFILGIIYIIPFIFLEFQMRFNERLPFSFKLFYKYTLYIALTLLFFGFTLLNL